jgi:SAM-dependent methyltransferase
MRPLRGEGRAIRNPPTASALQSRDNAVHAAGCVVCVVCGSTHTAPHRRDVEDLEYFVTTRRSFSVWKCEGCRSQFLDPRPDLDELAEIYPSHYHAYNEDHGAIAGVLVRLRARRRASFYRRLAGSGPRRLFDVGTGDCRHFDELRKRCDFEFAGVELKPDIAAKGRARGYQVIDGTLEEMDLTGHSGRYDVVSMNHVLEHVVDPPLVLRRAFELLRPGGWLIGQLPTIACWEARLFGRRFGGYHYPRHLQVPSRRGLYELFGRAGFVDAHVRTAPHIQSALSLQNVLVGLGYHPRMVYGKTPAYGALIVAVLPFEAVAWLADRGGIVDFRAHRPIEA